MSISCCLSISWSDVFFVFKQKTAYEMRTSDWSSDVCSSDLLGGVALLAALVGPLAGLQLPLDVHRAALAQVLLGDARQVLVEDHQPVPLGALALLAAALVPPALRGGQREVHDLGAVLGRSEERRGGKEGVSRC